MYRPSNSWTTIAGRFTISMVTSYFGWISDRKSARSIRRSSSLFEAHAYGASRKWLRGNRVAVVDRQAGQRPHAVGVGHGPIDAVPGIVCEKGHHGQTARSSLQEDVASAVRAQRRIHPVPALCETARVRNAVGHVEGGIERKEGDEDQSGGERCAPSAVTRFIAGDRCSEGADSRDDQRVRDD